MSSRRPLLLLGLGLMGVATVLFYLATNVYILVVNRFLQGLSAAIVYSGGLALLVDTVGQAEIGQWMGLALSSANMALLVAPLVGGIVYAHAGYHAVFAVMLTLVGADILLRLAVIEKRDAAKWRQRMRYGITAAEAPPPPLACATTHTASAAERQPLLGAPVGVDVVGAAKPTPPSPSSAAARRSERQRLPPMLLLLRSPRLLTAVYGVFIETILVIGFDSVVPTFVKRTFGWDSSRAGLIFLTITVPSLAAPLVGRLADRHGPRPVALSGFLLAGPTTAALALVDHESFRQIVLFCTLLTITGILFPNAISGGGFISVFFFIESFGASAYSSHSRPLRHVRLTARRRGRGLALFHRRRPCADDIAARGRHILHGGQPVEGAARAAGRSRRIRPSVCSAQRGLVCRRRRRAGDSRAVVRRAGLEMDGHLSRPGQLVGSYTGGKAA
jgi:MFS family permease